MFGFKKGKKQEGIYTGSYVVKDVDNIISIAQSYNIPWKELASVNDIEPPYILISGETIIVPGEDVGADDDAQKETQISDVVKPGHIAKQVNTNNTQIQQQTSVANDGVKNSLDTVTKASTSQITKEPKQQAQIISNKKSKAKKIIYAAPKNMLQKPSAEPTTRAIDIEWMQDDEAVYSEEIQSQRKKLNVQFIIISILVMIIIGLITWWGVTWFLEQNNNEDVSVQTLIEEDLKTDADMESVNNESKDTDMQIEEDLTVEETEDANETENQEDVNSEDKQLGEESAPVGEITIQVLNAGAKIGIAGDVTEAFATKGYKTIAAQNANNDYNNVVIYYSSDKEKYLDVVSKEVLEKYGIQKHEKSDEVTKKYSADFVVVLGS